MTLKKSLALLTALVLFCLAGTALAKTLSIGTTDLTLDVTGMKEESLTQEDLEDDVVAYLYNDEVDLCIYQYDADGYTLEELLEECQEDEEITQSGITDINGIQAMYYVGTFDYDGIEFIYITYCILWEEDLVQVDFYMMDAAASQTAADIMNTLAQ